MGRFRNRWRARRPGPIRYVWRMRRAERRILEQQGRLLVTVRYRDHEVRDVPLERVQRTIVRLIAEYGSNGSIEVS
jgi:hypothetical protein